MIVTTKQGVSGFQPITELNGPYSDMLLDFGILNLTKGQTFISTEPRERAFLLIKGCVKIEWENEYREVNRNSCFDEGPTVLHVPEHTAVTFTGISDQVELVIEECINHRNFTARIYLPEDCRREVFGRGLVNDASIRTVCTVFDGELAPWSNMVLGEVITHPGKWSSYPPHDHPHPEIYHYRFQPAQGFGVSLLDYDSYTVRNGDTCLIPPDRTHSQVAAAGYAMWYVWMIPHLPGNRWLPTTRFFRQEHKWLLDAEADIWYDKSVQGS